MSAEFVDTNVLVYAHDKSAGDKKRRAVTLIERLIDEGAGLLSTQVLMEFSVVVTRKLPRKLTAKQVSAIVEDFGTWNVFHPRVPDILKAIGFADRYSISFWDAMIVRAADALGAEIIWSEDLNHGQTYAGIRVENPFI